MFPEESIEKVFRIFVNKLLEKDKCEEGPQTADGRLRQDRLSSLSGRQTVNEWETNKRIQTATADRRRTGFPACQKPSTNGKTNQRMQTADGRLRQDRLSSLSGRQAVNEWETNKRIQTAYGGRLQCGFSNMSGRQTVNDMENQS
jgi:hypothetical protein